MHSSYLKIVFRNLLRSKGFSFINITGLAIGMASAILILLWIRNEVSYDKFYLKTDRLYRMNNRDKFNGELWAWSTTPKILGPTLKQENPEVEDYCRIGGASFLFTVGEKHLSISGNFTDTAFFHVFDFPLIQGNSATALKGIYNIVITQKLATKLFGNENALGKIIKIDSNDQFTVTGLMKDLPNNTSFDFEFLVPWAYMTKIGQDDAYWGNNSIKTYIILKPNTSQMGFDRKIKK